MDDFAKDFGPVALVTGASAGIGTSFARCLAAKGLDLVLVARRVERLEALAIELKREHGVNTTILQVDLAEEDAARRILDATSSLDIGLLVSNAGTGTKGRFEEFDPTEMTQILVVNCHAPMFLAHGFIPRLRKRGKGGIIFNSSTEGLIGCPFSSVYSSSKAFMTSLGEALWGELNPEGIVVLTVCPGATATARLERSDPNKTQPNVMSPHDVARLTLENIKNGPIYYPSPHGEAMYTHLLSLPRRDALTAMADGMRKMLAR